MRNLVKGSYVTRKAATVHDASPFTSDLSDRIQIGKNTVAIAGKIHGSLLNENDEELALGPVVGLSRKVEKKVIFLKLYIDGIRRILGLPKAASNVLMVLMESYYSGPFHKDRVYMTLKMAKEDYVYDYEEKTYHNGINTLIANEIIALSPQPNWYYTNSNFFFLGDRVTLVDEFRLIQAEKSEKEYNAIRVINGETSE